MNLITFIWLMIFAHYVGDYVLQIRWLAETKGKEWYNMLVHCVLYAGSVGWVLMKWTNGFPYAGMIMLFVSHWIIDTWKCHGLGLGEQDETSKKAFLYIDQLLHFTVLAIVIIWYK